MSLFEKKINSTSNSPTKEREKVNNVITVTAKTGTGNTKTVKIAAPKPQLTAVTWAGKDGRKLNKTKYGKRLYLHIDTEEACSSLLSALVVVHCDYWEEDYVALCPITKKEVFRIVKTNESGANQSNPKYWEKTIFSFIPNVKQIDPHKWANRKSDESKITAKVYLIFNSCINFMLSIIEENTYRLKQLVEAVKRDNDDPKNYTTGNIQKPHIYAEQETDQIGISKIVIVIDPGHGYKDSHQGTQCRGFQYYEKDEKGEPDKTKIKTAKASDLPPHVLVNIEKWIVKWIDTSVSVKEQEWYYVIQVSLKLKEELELENAYKIIFTRENIDEQIEQIKASDDFPNRRKIGNDNDTDYFLSIHCDGQGDKNTAHLAYKHTGFFVILPRDVDTNSQGEDIRLSKELGKDLVKHYSVLNHDKTPIWIANGEKGVLTKKNKAQRRLIVELGRMTNPVDIIKLFEGGTQDRIAKQLKDGIIYNIKKRYEEN